MARCTTFPPISTKRGIGGPVHGLLTGNRDERDRRIVIEQAPRFGIVGKEQTITFHVDDTTGGNGQPRRRHGPRRQWRAA